MDKKKTKQEAQKKNAKPSVKKVAAKPAKKAAVTKSKPVAAKASKPRTAKAVSQVALKPAPQVAPVDGPVFEVKTAPKVLLPVNAYGGSTLRLRWVRSAIGLPEKQKKVVKGLGFHRLNEVIVRPDTPMIRGMVRLICHLVEIVG
jgi:large subunit ribosomal protein L30